MLVKRKNRIPTKCRYPFLPRAEYLNPDHMRIELTRFRALGWGEFVLLYAYSSRGDRFIDAVSFSYYIELEKKGQIVGELVSYCLEEEKRNAQGIEDNGRTY